MSETNDLTRAVRKAAEKIMGQVVHERKLDRIETTILAEVQPVLQDRERRLVDGARNERETRPHAPLCKCLMCWALRAYEGEEP